MAAKPAPKPAAKNTKAAQGKGATKGKGAQPKKMSARKADKLRRKASLRGPLDGWQFPFALLTSLLIAGPHLWRAATDTVAIETALIRWMAALILSWVCWTIIASALRTSTDNHPGGAAAAPNTNPDADQGPHSGQN